jgi:Terminase large subunit, T4likevirus-type, N-terminal
MEPLMTARDPLAVRMTRYVPHTPHPRQHVFLTLNTREAFYGGAAGGGKSDALLMAALQYVDVPGYSALLVRRTYTELALPGAIMDRAIEWLAGTDARWNQQDKVFEFPSGASLAFGYLQHAADKFRYQSAEFQFVGFDEVSQFPEADYRYLFSRLRKPTAGPLSGVPLRMRSASNPGGIGHHWVRSRFVRREQQEDDVAPPEAGERVFVRARLADNPSLDQVSYEESLAELSSVYRRQLLDGDWDVREGGSCFTEFDWENHTLDLTRGDDSEFEVFRGFDFGFHHSPALWIEAQERTAFVFGELHCQMEPLPVVIAEMKARDKEYGLYTPDVRTFPDPAGMGTNYQTGKKDFDVLREGGIFVTDDKERYGRATRTNLIKAMLEQDRLFVSRDCPYLIDALERAVWDQTGDILHDFYKKDGIWDHVLDALGEALARIFTARRPAAAPTVPPSMSTGLAGVGAGGLDVPSASGLPDYLQYGRW